MDGVEVPPELSKLLYEFTKEALRTQPFDIIGYATKYFIDMQRKRSVNSLDKLHEFKNLVSTDGITRAKLTDSFFAVGLDKYDFESIARLWMCEKGADEILSDSEIKSFLYLTCMASSVDVENSLDRIYQLNQDEKQTVKVSDLVEIGEKVFSISSVQWKEEFQTCTSDDGKDALTMQEFLSLPIIKKVILQGLVETNSK